MSRILSGLLIILFNSFRLVGQTNKAAQIDSLVNLATISDSLMDLSSSVGFYTQVLSLDPKNLIALNNRGRAYVWQGQFEKGFADYDKAVKLYPHERTYYTRGMAYLNINQYDKAYPDLMKSLDFNPTFGEAYYGLSLIKANQDSFNLALELCSKADSISYQPLLSEQIRSTIFHLKQDYKSEIIELTKAIQINPTDPANYNNRGLAKNQLKQYKDAISDFDYAIKLDSSMAFAYNNKAFALLKLRQYKKALGAVNTSLKLNKSNPYAFKNRAEIFIATNSYQQACNDLKDAAQFSSDKKLTLEIKELSSKTCKE